MQSCLKTRETDTSIKIQGFNSLQTGRCVARGVESVDLRPAMDLEDYVSIPFKREGVLQAKVKMARRTSTIGVSVSIPFKREGVLRGP